MSETERYARDIQNAEKQIEDIEERISKAAEKGDQKMKDFLETLSKIWRLRVEEWRILGKAKASLMTIDENSLKDMVKQKLESLAFKVSEEVKLGYVKADLLGEKDDEVLLIEVKGMDNPDAEQLARYEDALMTRLGPMAKGKVVLVLPVLNGEDFEVWGLEQLVER